MRFVVVLFAARDVETLTSGRKDTAASCGESGHDTDDVEYNALYHLRLRNTNQNLTEEATRYSEGLDRLVLSVPN
jgi:hypothetical protein